MTYSRWKPVGPGQWMCVFCQHIAVKREDMLACANGCQTREDRERIRLREADKAAAPQTKSLF